MHMNIIERRPQYRMWLLAVTLGALAAGCNKDAILGVQGIAGLVPAVTAVTPLAGATGVSITNPQITATLNEPIAPITGTASMTVTCAAPCVNATGIVTLDATNTIATFTLTPGTTLDDVHGLYRHDQRSHESRPRRRDGWLPTSGNSRRWRHPPTLLRPRVSTTFRRRRFLGRRPGVPSNSAISAIFTKDMAPATISGTTLP